MADRTYVEVTIAACDLERVKDIFLPTCWRSRGIEFTYEESHPDGTVTVGLDDVNLGGVEEAEVMKGAGIPFILEHEAGGDYTPGTIACDGRRMEEIKTLAGQIVLFFNEDTGDAQDVDLQFAREFCELREAAMGLIRARAAEHLGSAHDCGSRFWRGGCRE
jgi:hypothetical protein